MYWSHSLPYWLVQHLVLLGAMTSRFIVLVSYGEVMVVVVGDGGGEAKGGVVGGGGGRENDVRQLLKRLAPTATHVDVAWLLLPLKLHLPFLLLLLRLLLLLL
jgi:hypothetical protein